MPIRFRFINKHKIPSGFAISNESHSKADKPFPSDKFLVVQTWLTNLAGDERLMIVIAASKLDELLKSLLQHVLIHEPGGADSLFGNDRPLGTFSSRILLSYRLGLIDRDFESFLQALRRLRNDAAHSSEHIDLSTSPHVDRVLHLHSLATKAPMWEMFADDELNPKANPRGALFTSITFAVLSLEIALLNAKRIELDSTCGFHLVKVLDPDTEPPDAPNPPNAAGH